mgnify:CR=1 FL=1
MWLGSLPGVFSTQVITLSSHGSLGPSGPLFFSGICLSSDSLNRRSVYLSVKSLILDFAGGTIKLRGIVKKNDAMDNMVPE